MLFGTNSHIFELLKETIPIAYFTVFLWTELYGKKVKLWRFALSINVSFMIGEHNSLISL